MSQTDKQRSVSMVAAAIAQNSVPITTKKKVFEHFKSTSIQGLPESLTAKKKSYKIGWFFVFVVSVSLCTLHMYYLMEGFYTEPDQTSISYKFESTLSFPTVQVCAPKSRFLNKKAFLEGKITPEYYYAIELGLGIRNQYDDFFYQWQLDLNVVQAEYEKILQKFGTVQEAAKDLEKNYLLPCTDVFRFCRLGASEHFNCCTAFKPVWTLQGVCFAANTGTLNTTGPGSLLGTLQIRLVDHPVAILSQVQQSQPGPHFAQLQVGLSDRLEQSPQWPNAVTLKRHDQAEYRIRKQRRIFINNCVHKGHLQHFQNYTLSNCQWERNFLNKLDYANLTCQLPVTTLMNQTGWTQANCGLDEILKLYKFIPEDGNMPAPESLVQALEGATGVALNQSVLPCALPEGESDLRPCSHIDIWTLYGFDPAAQIPKNKIPLQMLSVLSQLINLSNSSSINYCPYECEFNRYIYNYRIQAFEDDLPQDQISVQIYFETNDIEVIVETPRQTFSEYLAFIGGNFGLWTGASLISIAHFWVLAMKAVYGLFCEKETKSEVIQPPTKVLADLAKQVTMRQMSESFMTNAGVRNSINRNVKAKERESRAHKSKSVSPQRHKKEDDGHKKHRSKSHEKDGSKKKRSDSEEKKKRTDSEKRGTDDEKRKHRSERRRHKYKKHNQTDSPV